VVGEAAAARRGPRGGRRREGCPTAA